MWKVDKLKEPVTGTTAAAYATALDWEVSELTAKSIHLKNTDGSNSLKFKVLVTYSDGQTTANAATLVPETPLLAGDDIVLTLTQQYHRVILQVINNSGAATYEVNREGMGV